MFKPRRKKEAQSEFWVVADRLPKASPTRFYELLNDTLTKMNLRNKCGRSALGLMRTRREADGRGLIRSSISRC